MKQEQMQKLREDMLGEILEVVESYRVEVGNGLMASDVVGVLEWAKMEVFMESSGDLLLRHTSYDLG